MEADERELIAAAEAVRARAYAPYSDYFVGAAIVDEAGRIHVGCNVENGVYPQGSCAEQNAIGAMVAAGGAKITAIAIVGGSQTATDDCSPCGACRQRLREFSDEHTDIILLDARGRAGHYRIDQLLPAAFRAPGK